MVCRPEDCFNERHEIRDQHRVAMAVADPERIFLENVSAPDDQIACLDKV
jgi:hypothetical protein